MKNEVVIFSGQRNRYDGAFQIPGGVLVEYGAPGDVTPDDLDAVITDNTCTVAFVIGPFIDPGIGLERTIEVAHARQVPVILDAAAEVPPRANLSRFIKMGVDMVAFSGGKGIAGPQSAGLLAGRADLMDAAFANSLNLHSPKAGIGRPMKVSKENIVGMVTALQLYMEGDEQAEMAGWRAKAEYVAGRIRNIPGLTVKIEDDPAQRQGAQPVIYFDHDWAGPAPDEVRRRLKDGDPAIYVGGGGRRENEINIVMVDVLDGQEIVIADWLLEALADR